MNMVLINEGKAEKTEGDQTSIGSGENMIIPVMLH
jgi:hypothetical protein